MVSGNLHTLIPSRSRRKDPCVERKDDIFRRRFVSPSGSYRALLCRPSSLFCCASRSHGSRKKCHCGGTGQSSRGGDRCPGLHAGLPSSRHRHRQAESGTAARNFSPPVGRRRRSRPLHSVRLRPVSRSGPQRNPFPGPPPLRGRRIGNGFLWEFTYPYPFEIEEKRPLR